MRLCGISSRFQLLSPSVGQVAHALLTRPPLSQRNVLPEGIPFQCFVRLACVKHAASVHPEPGSNSHINCFSCQIFIWLFSGILFSKDLFSELFSAPFSGRPFGIFQGCITVRLSRCCCLIRFGVFVLHPLSSATAYLEYHKLFALSTTFLKLFQLFSTPFFLSDSGLSY